jgi:hypothetical protein
MTWTAVGTFGSASGSSTFSLTPGNSGDLVLLEVVNNSAYATSVSSSNATWVQVGSNFQGTSGATLWINVWAGTTSSTSTATVTISGMGSPSIILTAWQEFNSSVGSWAYDAIAGQANMDSSTLTYGSLTAGHGSGELYYGFAVWFGTPTGGSTSGYTYDITAGTNGLCFNPACSTSPQAPVWTGTVGDIEGIAVMMYETGVTGPPAVFYPRPSNRVVTLPFFAGVAGKGHSI